MVPHYKLGPYRVVLEGGEEVSLLARDPDHAVSLLNPVESVIEVCLLGGNGRSV